MTGILATHDYGSTSAGTLARPAPPAGNTHPIWETETTLTSGAAIDAGLDLANAVYAALTTGGVSGWLYRWTPSLFDGGSVSSPPKRIYALGNFSKFVRPGYVRVDVTGAPSGVQFVAFDNPPDDTVAIVAVNSGTSAQSVSVFVAGTAWPSQVTQLGERQPRLADGHHTLGRSLFGEPAGAERDDVRRHAVTSAVSSSSVGQPSILGGSIRCRWTASAYPRPARPRFCVTDFVVVRHCENGAARDQEDDVHGLRFRSLHDDRLRVVPGSRPAWRRRGRSRGRPSRLLRRLELRYVFGFWLGLRWLQLQSLQLQWHGHRIQLGCLWVEFGEPLEL
jgi:hypothetical protein